MAGEAKHIWLYVRMAGLVLVILFALHLFIVNAFVDGQARVVPWWPSNLWSLLAAFAMGLLVWPLYKAARLTWRDFATERAKQHEETKAPVTPGRQQPERPAPQPEPAEQKPAASEGDAGLTDAGRSAADVWTSGEEEPHSR